MPHQVRIRYSEDRGRLKPMTDVTFFGPRRVQSFPAIIDSGADLCIFHTACATDVELDLTAAVTSEIRFGGSSHEARLVRDVRVVVRGIELRVDIAFTEGLRLGHGLLGRDNFFRRFRGVAFYERESYVTLHPMEV